MALREPEALFAEHAHFTAIVEEFVQRNVVPRATVAHQRSCEAVRREDHDNDDLEAEPRIDPKCEGVEVRQVPSFSTSNDVPEPVVSTNGIQVIGNRYLDDGGIFSNRAGLALQR
ncbi:hypothetical protein CDL60_09060 [Roseateles noduli]|nr:hypothetical protein CDL60_09060 [Roseateles noduli]